MLSVLSKTSTSVPTVNPFCLLSTFSQTQVHQSQIHTLSVLSKTPNKHASGKSFAYAINFITNRNTLTVYIFLRNTNKYANSKSCLLTVNFLRNASMPPVVQVCQKTLLVCRQCPLYSLSTFSENKYAKSGTSLSKNPSSMPPMSSLLTVNFLKKQVRQQWYKFVKNPFKYAASVLFTYHQLFQKYRYTHGGTTVKNTASMATVIFFAQLSSFTKTQAC